MYYFRMGVPQEFRAAIGKTEIIKSLRTTDFREAKRLVVLESAHADELLAKERRKLKRVSTPPQKLGKLSEAEIHRLVFEWFIGEERHSLEWWEQQGQSLSAETRGNILDTLAIDATAINGRSHQYEAEDTSPYLDSFLAEKGLECPKDSAEYKKLLNVFRAGRLETISRLRNTIERKPFEAGEPLFRDVFAHTILPAKIAPSITLGDLLDRFLAITKEKRSETTFTSYQTPARVIREILGEGTPLNAITRADMERLTETIKELPRNARQRYPDLSAKEAIAAAAKCGDLQRLAPKSLENYFINITAVFNFAVGEKFISESPADYRSFKESLRTKDTTRKELFSSDELRAIFSAPLYSGCLNDQRGFAKPGPSVIRRGRFWVPLIALFQGTRLNEACQLYTEDLRERDGIPYFSIREDLDADEKTEKRLKNSASVRDVPIHPTLIRMGFLEFVADRRRDSAAPRLFPELPIGKTGRYSNPFSKWFSGFLIRAIGYKPRATFHSFRHHFRTALRLERVGDENVEALGGWSGDDKQQRKYGAAPTLRLLLADLEKVQFPELDLSHLFER